MFIIKLWDILPITYCCDHPCFIIQVHIFFGIYYIYKYNQALGYTTNRWLLWSSLCFFTSADPFWKILYINIIQLWDILPITYCCDHPCIITQVFKYIHILIYIYNYIYVYSISRSISITTSRFTCASIHLISVWIPDADAEVAF